MPDLIRVGPDDEPGGGFRDLDLDGDPDPITTERCRQVGALPVVSDQTDFVLAPQHPEQIVDPPLWIEQHRASHLTRRHLRDLLGEQVVEELDDI